MGKSSSGALITKTTLCGCPDIPGVLVCRARAWEELQKGSPDFHWICGAEGSGPEALFPWGTGCHLSAAGVWDPLPPDYCLCQEDLVGDGRQQMIARPQPQKVCTHLIKVNSVPRRNLCKVYQHKQSHWLTGRAAHPSASVNVGNTF